MYFCPTMYDSRFEIDLIYLWVDGNDPHWRAKKNAFTGQGSDHHSENNFAARYTNNDELKYTLRSAEKYAPWIRRIFIVTDNQKPDWLNENHPKIQIIDHRDILPAASLPCFNSSVIEYFLYKIPNLSEHFLYANDDMFFASKLTPGFFFAADGFPVVRLTKKPFGKWRYLLKNLTGKKLGQYRQMIWDASLLVEEKFGKYYSGIPHHNIDAYRKTDFKTAVEDVFADQINRSVPHHLRTFGDMHRSAFSYYALAIGHAHLKYVDYSESCILDVNKNHYQRYLDRYQPSLFCLNDNQHSTDSDRAEAKRFLDGLFPLKSAFEK